MRIDPINIDDLPENTAGDYSPIPAGDYTVVIKAAEIKKTSDESGEYLKVRLDVTGPTHAGRVVFGRINVKNKSSQAEQIGRAQLRDLMKALGINNLTDTDQLLGGELTVKVSVREGRTDPASGKVYDPENDIKAYKPLPGKAAMPTAAKPGPSAPPASAPAKSAAPPWAKK